jgi:hypothetical protein
MSDNLPRRMPIVTRIGDPIGFYPRIENALNDPDFSVDGQMLGLLMSGQYAIRPDGQIYNVRHLAAKIGKIRISVNSDEHPPPHFHVDGPALDACFTIADCEHMKGRINSRDLAAIKTWYKSARPKIIRLWNKTRPDGCPVGPFQE